MNLLTFHAHGECNACRIVYYVRPVTKQVAQLSQRDRATHELLRFAKLRSGIFEPPFWGLRGNIDASCVRR